MFAKLDLFLLGRFQKLSDWISTLTSIDHWQMAQGCLTSNLAGLIFINMWYFRTRNHNLLSDILFTILIIVLFVVRYLNAQVVLTYNRRSSKVNDLCITEQDTRCSYLKMLGLIIFIDTVFCTAPFTDFLLAELLFGMHCYFKAVIDPPPKEKESWVLAKSRL